VGAAAFVFTGAGVLLGARVPVAAGNEVSLGAKVTIAAGRVFVGRTGLLGPSVFVNAGACGAVLVGRFSIPIVKVPLQAVMIIRIRTAGKARHFIRAS